MFTGAMSHLQALDASITAPVSGVGGSRALDQRPREHGAGGAMQMLTVAVRIFTALKNKMG